MLVRVFILNKLVWCLLPVFVARSTVQFHFLLQNITQERRKTSHIVVQIKNLTWKEKEITIYKRKTTKVHCFETQWVWAKNQASDQDTIKVFWSVQPRWLGVFIRQFLHSVEERFRHTVDRIPLEAWLRRHYLVS